MRVVRGRRLIPAALLVLVGVLAMHGAPVVAGGCHREATAGHTSTSAGTPVTAAMPGPMTASLMTGAGPHGARPKAAPAPDRARTQTATGHGSVCVSAPPRKAAAGLLLMLLLTVALGFAADAITGTWRGRRLRSRSPPVRGQTLLLRLCVSRT